MDYFSSEHPLALALRQRGYTDLTSVQSAVLASGRGEQDLLVSAQTGSGKTVAYGLALADSLLGEAQTLPFSAEPLALIIAPTRELALQVHGELTWLYGQAGARVVSCVGGMDPRREQRLLAAGCHIVVGTPGRLRDHMERGALITDGLRAVVLDEADEMLDMGFREDLEAILQTTPVERRTLLFSATLPREIITLARQYQRNATRIELTAGPQGHADIEYRVMRIAPNDTEHAVVNLLRYFDSPTTMVFCSTREAVRHLQASLLERGFGVVALSGELSQNERNHALQSLRDGRARVCVATDVAARGIDLPSLDLVIHADLPRTAETLQHRSGRTGRAGRKGVSALLVPLSRRRKAEQMLHTAGVVAEWGSVPGAEQIRVLDQQRLLTNSIFTEELGEDDLSMAAAVLENHDPQRVAAALVRLYRAQLPAAEDVYDPGPDLPPSRERFGAPARFSDDDRPMQWFRLNIGRLKNADPRWLLPLICRQGRISKRDVGQIRIMERETRFQVDAAMSERFQAALRQVVNPEGRIELLRDAHGMADGGEAPAAAGKKAHGGKPPYKPHRGKADSKDFRPGAPEGKPYKGKPDSKPHRGKSETKKAKKPD